MSCIYIYIYDISSLRVNDLIASLNMPIYYLTVHVSLRVGIYWSQFRHGINRLDRLQKRK